MAANLTLYKELGYDPQKELVLISPFASFTIVVTASKKLGVTTVNDLIERAKKEPGALNYGSVGIGSSQHLAGEYFAQVAKVKLTHVPYRNIAQFGPDLIAGTVQLGFAWYPNVSGPLTADGAIALAVAGDARLPALPNRRQRRKNNRRAASSYSSKGISRRPGQPGCRKDDHRCPRRCYSRLPPYRRCKIAHHRGEPRPAVFALRCRLFIPSPIGRSGKT